MPYSPGMRPPNNPGINKWCGAALRVRRAALGITMEELAKLLGVGKSTIKRWEHEENAPTADMLQKICKAMGEERPAVFGRKPKIS